MEVHVTALSHLAAEVRKDEFGYPPKSRAPEGVIAGGALVGGLGALGVNNAVQLPRRSRDALVYHQRRLNDSKPKAAEAKARAASASRLNPKRSSFERAALNARADAVRDVNNLRANKHVIRNMRSHQLRMGMSGGALLTAGAGLAALGSRMRGRRDDYSAA